jgi:hypothetical protein
MFYRDLNGMVINPYAVANQPKSGGHGSSTSYTKNAENTTTTNNMGCQSQLREGAIKKCKKKATRTKYKVDVVARSQGEAFVPLLHCHVCKSKKLLLQGKKIVIPHRSHHKHCPLNRKTRGNNTTTQQNMTAFTITNNNNNNINNNNNLNYFTQHVFTSTSANASQGGKIRETLFLKKDDEADVNENNKINKKITTEVTESRVGSNDPIEKK